MQDCDINILPIFFSASSRQDISEHSSPSLYLSVSLMGVPWSLEALMFSINSDGVSPVVFFIAVKKVVLELKPACRAIPSRVRLAHSGLGKFFFMYSIRVRFINSLKPMPYARFTRADNW